MKPVNLTVCFNYFPDRNDQDVHPMCKFLISWLCGNGATLRITNVIGVMRNILPGSTKQG